MGSSSASLFAARLRAIQTRATSHLSHLIPLIPVNPGESRLNFSCFPARVVTRTVHKGRMPTMIAVRKAEQSESGFDGRATGRDRGPPRMRRPRGGAGRRPAAVSDK